MPPGLGAPAGPHLGARARVLPSVSSVEERIIMSRLYLSPPHMSGEELSLIEEAFRSNWIAPLGPHVDALEREFAEAVGVRHAAALSSGTAALHLAVRLAGVRPGDEVL